MEKEAQQFLDEFEKPVNDDPFAFLEEPKKEETPAEAKPEPEGSVAPADPEPRNRRERRLMEKLQAEKDAAIALAARLEAVSESQKVRTEESQFLEVAERIYGTQTPELREATELLKTALLGVKEEAKKEALAEFNAVRQKEQEAVQNAEKRLDEMVEQIEDEINADLSPAQRTEFFKLLEKMSPKDGQGNIVEYADHFAVWDIYQEKTKKPANPAKDIVARGMVQGGGSTPSNLSNDSHEAWLRSRGII